MLKEIKIQDYKPVQDLTLELGRINVLVGADGCGKTLMKLYPMNPSLKIFVESVKKIHQFK